MLVAIAVAALPGCLGSPRALPTAEELTASSALSAHDSNSEQASATTLRRGRQTLMTSCAECHGLPYPDSHPPARWPGLVSNMQKRANLSAEDAAAVTAYLQAASAQAQQSR